jgi:uncharacterized membrane protein
MKSQRMTRRVALCVATVLTATMAPAVVRAKAQSETLIVAVYEGQNTAMQAFKTVVKGQGETGERVEEYAVVSKDPKGKVHVLDQRKTEAGMGAVIGAVVGLFGGPAGAAVGAGAGGAVGYLTGNAVGIPREKVDSIKQSLTPDSSALIVVLYDRWRQDVERDMKQAHAREVISNQIAGKPEGAPR